MRDEGKKKEERMWKEGCGGVILEFEGFWYKFFHLSGTLFTLVDGC